MEMEFIGDFAVVSGQIIISDPCYERKESLNYLASVRNGTWRAYTEHGSESRIIQTLVVHHEKIKLENLSENNWERLTYVPIHSGKAGFFDYLFYRDNNNTKQKDDLTKLDSPCKTWFAMCCDVTFNQEGSGIASVVPNGVVSCSGNGLYNCFAQYKKEKMIALKIDFMKEENSDEDDQDLDDEEDYEAEDAEEDRDSENN